MGWITGSGRPPGRGQGNPLQSSCQENPMDIGAWQATSSELQRVGHNWSDLAHMHTIQHCHVLGGNFKYWKKWTHFFDAKMARMWLNTFFLSDNDENACPKLSYHWGCFLKTLLLNSFKIWLSTKNKSHQIILH